jgi:hypothetical protein
MERARTITDRAQDEAAAMITRAQAEVAAAMERAQQIVADANTLAELIKANAAVIAQADRNVLEGGEPAPGPEHAVPVTLTRLSLSYKATRHPIEDHNRFNLRGQPLRSGRFPSDAMALPIHSANSPGSIGNDVIAGATENDRCPSFDTWLPADVERSGSSVCRLSEALIGLDVMMRSDERILNHGSPAFYRSVRDLRPWSVLLVSGIGALVGGFAGNVICNGRLGGQPEVDRVFARGSAWSRPGTDAVLLRMIRMRRDGARASEISQSLNWDAVPTPSGLRKWTSADVVRLLCTSRATELISQMTANHGIARRLEETCSVG